MSKRRISNQQSSRIEKKQRQYRQQTTTGVNRLTTEGLVITHYGQHALIETPEGKRFHCSIRPNIDSLVAGDQVVWQLEGQNQGVVVSRQPRQSILGRADKQGRLKPVAANITQVFIVLAPKPEISWPLLDSYLVMIEYLKLHACIVLNKSDLPCKPLQQKLIEEYESLDYKILFTSHQDKKGYKQLCSLLNEQISVFVGQSGVGKSSIIAQILPLETSIQTAAISEHSDLGRHTTSNSCLYHLSAGGLLIDSPGVRELGLWHMDVTDIAQGYREFRPYLSACKFRNCDHQNSPGCAIRTAVDNQQIAQHRYDNYVRIAAQFAKKI